MHDHTRSINDATYAAGDAHDPAAVAAVFAEDAVVREAGAGQEAHGRAAAPFAAFPT